MTRVEIDIDGGMLEENPTTFSGKLELRVVREEGENSTDRDSLSGNVESFVAKGLEAYLKEFLPHYEKMLDEAARQALKNESTEKNQDLAK